MKNSYNKHKYHFIYSFNLKKSKLIIIFFLIIFNISFFITLKITEKNIQPSITSLAKSTVSTEILSIINSSIMEIPQFDDNLTSHYSINKNKSGDITSITANTNAINNSKQVITEKILKKINSSNIQNLKIPTGNLTGLNILNGRGPKINVKVMTTASPKVNFENKFESVGINHTKNKTSVIVSVDIEIVLPYETLQETVTYETLLAETIIMGKIPDVYISK